MGKEEEDQKDADELVGCRALAGGVMHPLFWISGEVVEVSGREEGGQKVFERVCQPAEEVRKLSMVGVRFARAIAGQGRCSCVLRPVP